MPSINVGRFFVGCADEFSAQEMADIASVSAANAVDAARQVRWIFFNVWVGGCECYVLVCMCVCVCARA